MMVGFSNSIYPQRHVAAFNRTATVADTGRRSRNRATHLHIRRFRIHSARSPMTFHPLDVEAVDPAPSRPNSRHPLLPWPSKLGSLSNRAPMCGPPSPRRPAPPPLPRCLPVRIPRGAGPRTPCCTLMRLHKFGVWLLAQLDTCCMLPRLRFAQGRIRAP